MNVSQHHVIAAQIWGQYGLVMNSQISSSHVVNSQVSSSHVVNSQISSSHMNVSQHHVMAAQIWGRYISSWDDTTVWSWTHVSSASCHLFCEVLWSFSRGMSSKRVWEPHHERRRCRQARIVTTTWYIQYWFFIRLLKWLYSFATLSGQEKETYNLVLGMYFTEPTHEQASREHSGPSSSTIASRSWRCFHHSCQEYWGTFC